MGNTVINPLLLCDSYKLGHADQYPEGTEYIYSNFTARSFKHAGHHFILNNVDESKIVVFGLQAVLKDMNRIWNDGFFKREKSEVIEEFINFISNNGFVSDENALKRMEFRISQLHDYGKLPVKINALKEGSLVGVKIPVLTIINTEKEFYWITNYLETWLSANLWKVMTSATISYQYRKIIAKYAKITGIDKDDDWSSFIDWQGHDFSMRGMSGVHDARLTGLGHLVNFKGSDTLIAAQYAKEMYGFGLSDNYCYASSIPATEHSVMCMGTAYLNDKEQNGEFNLFKKLITETYPNGFVSLVSDTWDYWKVLTEYLPKLKNTILNRNGKVVIRPDSGNPIHIIAGYRIYCKVNQLDNNNAMTIYHAYCEDKKNTKIIDDKCIVQVESENNSYYEIIVNNVELCIKSLEKHIVEGSVATLWNIFGGTSNMVDGVAYRTLDNHIGLIYGDSITLERCEEILNRLSEKGFSSANIVFGIGSYTYNYNTRDTFGFAMKATYGIVNGQGFNIYKDPITDSDKMKKSATGLLRVVNGKLEDKVELKKNENVLNYSQGELIPVFFNGELLVEYNLEDIRQNMLNC